MSEQDSVDRHIAHWSRELSDLDPQVEGIVTRMQILVRLLRRNKETWLASSGFKPWEFEVLHHLVAAGPPYQVTPSLLTEWLDTHPATLTNRLDRLERAGYITRVPDPGDRRRLLVALTDGGARCGRSAWRRATGRKGHCWTCSTPVSANCSTACCADWSAAWRRTVRR